MVNPYAEITVMEFDSAIDKLYGTCLAAQLRPQHLESVGTGCALGVAVAMVWDESVH